MMWGGVVDALALLKFSTSPNIFGDITSRITIDIEIAHIGRVSLTMKYGKNFILSISGFTPIGFEDPLLCRRIRCTNTKVIITIGNKKCSEKKRFRVGWDTEKFPQIQFVIGFPT